MVKKVQLPVIGGIRKTVTIPDPTATVGTTIAGLANQTITIAQLQALLGMQPPKPNSQGGGNSAALVLGPGLSGGGPLVGAVPLNLTAPIPAFIFEDSGGGDGDPGPPGANGAAGAVGPTGPAAFLSADDPEPALDAIPGSVGPTGSTGATGAIGSAVFLSADDGEDGWHAIPGPQGPQGPAGTGTAANITPDTHPTVANAADDEFEVGSTIDTAGTRRAGATPWTIIHQPTGSTYNVASGGLILDFIQPTNIVNSSVVGQAIPAGAWEYQTKLVAVEADAASMLTPQVNLQFALMAYNSGNGRLTGVGMQYNATGIKYVVSTQWTSTTAFSGDATLLQVNGGSYVITDPRTIYFRLAYDGTANFTTYFSMTGYPGTWQSLGSTTLASFLTAITHIALLVGNAATGSANDSFNASVDWFRRTV